MATSFDFATIGVPGLVFTIAQIPSKEFWFGQQPINL
jgi:hypothetical protein